MKAPKSSSKVSNNSARLGLCEANPSLDVVEKGPAKHLFKDEVEAVGFFEIFDQLDDVFLATAQVVNLDLFENLRPVEEAGHLLNDLDGVLDAGEDVDAVLHLAVAALAKALPGELVEVGEGVAHHRRPLLLLPPPRLHHLCQVVRLLWRGRAGRGVVNNHLSWNITGNGHLVYLLSTRSTGKSGTENVSKHGAALSSGSDCRGRLMKQHSPC